MIILIVGAVLAFSCTSHRKLVSQESRTMQYWESLPDCCIGEINDNFYDGVILDGRKLSQVDRWFLPNVKLLLKMEIDSLQAFDYMFIDSTVMSFECQCLDSTQLSDSPHFIVLKDKTYFRQYIGMILDGTPYLFISFMLIDPHCTNSRKQYEQCYHINRLIYSRCFIAPGLDFHPCDNVRFWMLYNITNKEIYTIP